MGYTFYPATEKQINFLEELFFQQGFTRVQRNAFCARVTERLIEGLSDLSKQEASNIISELLEQRPDAE